MLQHVGIRAGIIRQQHEITVTIMTNNPYNEVLTQFILSSSSSKNKNKTKKVEKPQKNRERSSKIYIPLESFDQLRLEREAN